MVETSVDGGGRLVVPVQRDIGHLLRTGRRMHSWLRDQPSPSVLTPPQFVVLLALCRVPGINQRTVGELASLDQATVSGVVNRLQSKSLVTSTPDPSDGRQKLLYPAGPAAEMVREDSARLRAADQVILKPLASSEKERLIGELANIAYAHEVDPVTRKAEESEQVDVFSVAETSRAFGRLIRVCQQLHASIWMERAGTLVTPEQFTMLAVVDEETHVNQSDLCRLLCLDKVTVAGMVFRLQRNGYLLSNPHAGDKRRRVIELTHHGRNALKLTSPAASLVQEELLKPIRQPAPPQVARLLERVIDSWERYENPNVAL